MQNGYRFLAFLGMLSLTASILEGCSRADYSNNFNAKTDYQYQYFQPDSSLASNMTEDEDGNVYYLSGCYIYKFDKKTRANKPLCNKSNCLHDKEKSLNRFDDCNAYFPYTGTEMLSSIAYESGYVYITDPDYRGKWKTKLIRISKDGSERKLIHQFPTQYMNCIFHRGYFYYVEQLFDKNNNQIISLKRYPLKENAKSKTLWTCPKSQTAYGIQSLKAYGQYLYFNFTGESNKGKTAIDKFYVYNIKSKKMRELKPKGYKNASIFDLMFFNGKIMYYCQDNDNFDKTYNADLYECNLDGSDLKKTGITMEAGCDIYSDGKYLIVSNDNVLSINRIRKKENADKPAEYKVYDKKYKLVDTYTEKAKKDIYLNTDSYTHYYAPVGIGNISYCLEHNSENGTATLYAGSKNQIGKLKGKEFKRKKLAAVSSSPAWTEWMKGVSYSN